MSAENAIGRREARKRATRIALHDAAVTLMSERGFHATTVADIATAAGVSPRTYFSYFPSKEAALFSPVDDVVSSLEEALADKPDDIDTFTALRTWITAEIFEAGALPPDLGPLLDHLAQEASTIAVHGFRYLNRLAGSIGAAIRRDLGVGPDDPRPEMVAASAVAAIQSGMDVGQRHGRPQVSPAEMMRNLDDALTFARGGLAALG